MTVMINRDELFSQIGSKRPWIGRVLEMVKGKHIDTIFDPCAGAGHLPIAIGEDKGAKVFLNDVNPVNYYYLRRKCGGERLSDDNFEDWKASSPKNGYFTANFSRPKKGIRSYVVGLVKNANSWLMKEYVAELLRRGFSRGNSWDERETGIPSVSNAKDYLDKVHGKQYGIDTDYKITNETIENLDFPECDLVIFDPPYQGQASPQSVDSEILLQKELNLSFPHNKLGEILEELKEVSKYQLFFGGPKEAEKMEGLGLEVEEWELTTGGADWNKGSKERVEYVHTSLSKFSEELSNMETRELLKLERKLIKNPFYSKNRLQRSLGSSAPPS